MNISAAAEGIYSKSNRRLRSVECAFIGFVNSCAAFVVNLVLNYVLIFGAFGFPELAERFAENNPVTIIANIILIIGALITICGIILIIILRRFAKKQKNSVRQKAKSMSDGFFMLIPKRGYRQIQ